MGPRHRWSSRLDRKRDKHDIHVRMWSPADADRAYEELLQGVRADANVLGVVLVGSRAVQALVTERSDYDVYLILHESDERYTPMHGSPVETIGMTLERFGQHAVSGSDLEWNRPAFLQATVVLDKLDGGIAALVARLARLSDEDARSIAAEALDDYINAMYRSLRNIDDGRDLAGRLDAAESIGPLLRALFAMESRVRPFNKWLVHELERAPLPIGDLLPRVAAISANGDPTTQRSVFRDVEDLARARGHGAVIDGWEPDVAWLRGT